MSVDVYTGVPGSGKSLHAASDIRFALNMRRPKPVLANFRLGEGAPVAHPERFTYLPNDEMSAGRLVDFACDFWDSGVYPFHEDFLELYIDECQLLFNSRRWSDRSRMAYLEFLSQSRKYGYHVVLIAQSAKMIDNQFRMLIDTEYNHRRVANFGLVGALLALPFRSRLFLVVRYTYQIQERLGMELRMFHKRDAAMYDSYARFERQDG